MTPITISIVALMVSSISLCISAFSVFRDRANVFAYAEVFYDYVDVPSFRLIIVNKGRRTIFLKHLCLVYSDGTSRIPFKQPKVLTDKNDIFQGVEPMLAHKSSIKLSESETYEWLVPNEEWLQLVHLGNSDVQLPNDMFFEDAKGKKIKVKSWEEKFKEYIQTTDGA